MIWARFGRGPGFQAARDPGAVGHLVVRDPKGGRDRVVLLPRYSSRRSHRAVGVRPPNPPEDFSLGAGNVELPLAFRRKSPSAESLLAWQWLFPATRTYWHAETSRRRRHHLHETVTQRAVRAAVRAVGSSKRITCHTSRHSLATPLLESGTDIRTMQELFGHRSLETTMIYTHVLNGGLFGVQSHLDPPGPPECSLP